ncbi:MAG: phosphate-starvation-inducible PsiE family protein [Nitrospirae bacterium]|nr:phosphate-starvation-inducible PsiE family protein [Nitrospirota bacterium]
MRTWSLSLDPILEVDPPRLFVKGIKAVLGLMLGLILVTLTAGIIAVALELRELLVRDVEEVLRHMLVGILLLLAVIEVFKTTLAYLAEGRVKVTFIVDTILVVMLTEIIALWLKGGTWTAFGLLLGVIAALAGLRVMTIRFSPSAMRSADAEMDVRG